MKVTYSKKNAGINGGFALVSLPLLNKWKISKITCMSITLQIGHPVGRSEIDKLEIKRLAAKIRLGWEMRGTKLINPERALVTLIELKTMKLSRLLTSISH